MISFDFLGFKIKISFFFLFIFCFYLIVDRSGMIPYFMIFSALHEIGHCIAYKIVDGRKKILTLSPFGFGLLIDEKDTYGIKYFIILLCGPAVNLILACVLYNIDSNFFWINLSLFLINSFPIMPLDGGRIMAMIFDFIFGRERGEKRFKTFEIFFLILLYILLGYSFALCEINISFILFILYITFLFAKSG